MIMPRMNSASAGEAGGSLAIAEAGSLLLGLPGAPGWTTAGDAVSVCAPALTARIRPHNTAHAHADRGLCPRRERCGRQFGTVLKTLILNAMKTCSGILTLSKNKRFRRMKREIGSGKRFVRRNKPTKPAGCYQRIVAEIILLARLRDYR